jgi:hypothetical protein
MLFVPSPRPHPHGSDTEQRRSEIRKAVEDVLKKLNDSR